MTSTFFSAFCPIPLVRPGRTGCDKKPLSVALTADAEENSPYEIMSSLSRRACYKCGELGHHAEACSSPHRLCYNCKQNPPLVSCRASH
ncbi:hypothetical protein B0T26DRAFT_682552 [Lasiosphaeria miniovina]|uniref:CCHC-type domain-containing protein n=1 Tax=Lasiosphaeria miniovina TaxID=1954250 RepID=A0AA40BEX2_9PEZI|nr:uncharacterized protein B0T26DRAFT_682552 [Lasiosphaeria miniovina]KAK0732990.1 hypothetical protein B0T26DRAFT_682552 [Lasiosphaeria miniovina]